MPRNLSQFIILGFLGAFSGAILGGASLFFLPKQYESSMEVRRVQVPSSVLKTPPGAMDFATEMPDGYFYRSRNCFELVSERLKLPERWDLSENEVLKVMRESVQVEGKGGGIHGIVVRRPDPDETFQMANSLLEAYRERLVEMYSDTADNLPDPLELLKPPTRPKTFVHPRVDLVLSMGAAAGLLIGLALAFFLQCRQVPSP